MQQRAVRRHSWRTLLAVALVLALAGLMFTASARLARGGVRHPENLAGLVQQRSNEVASLSAQVSALSAEVDSLTGSSTVPLPTLSSRLRLATDLASGVGAFSGPGVVVTLRDASSGIVPPGAVPDDLVVHQQDIQAVVNALWAGGAEAVTIQGQRVTTLTAVRCVGNVLYLHGQVYSPPYTVAAVGSADALDAALDADPAIAIYKEYVQAYGLGWDVVTDQTIEVPAAEGSAILHQATVPQGTDLFR